MASLFVPGRLCLFGEHSDWAGALRRVDADLAPGACIITGTDQGIQATVETSDDFEIVSYLPVGERLDPFRVVMQEEPLRHATQSGGFFRYAAGVAYEVWKRYRPPGVRIVADKMDLPMARGLSSSAAICVLTARAFNQVHALGLDVREEMDLAYHGEIAAGSKCGRMDQACAYGRSLLWLGFDGDEMRVEALCPLKPVQMLIVDLAAEKNTPQILADLHRHFLVGQGRVSAALRDALGRSNLELIALARAAVETGDARGVGELMTEAQRRFDAGVAPACPSELTSPRLHALLGDPAVRDLTWGGKGVGSQGDGSAQFVCRGEEERAALSGVLAARRDLRCLPLTIRPA